jgi:hypothetical protein
MHIVQILGGQVCSASGDGLVLVTVYDMRAPAPILAKQGAHHVRQMIIEIVPEHYPDTTRLVLVTVYDMYQMLRVYVLLVSPK